jgi:Glycosyl transferase family 2
MDVSVLTPSYEYGRFIADGIESVIQQQGLRLQHIIQDAGSGDETLEVLRSFGDRVEWASETDLGQSDGLNRALPKATGDWIAWLNADEYYLPDGLRVLVEEGERSGADVVYGDCVTVDREGRVIGLRPQHPFSRLILRLYGPFPESVSLIIRRTSLGEDPWDPSLRTVMDWDLYLGLAAEGASFHYVPYPIGAFRQHDSQASDRGGRDEARPRTSRDPDRQMVTQGRQNATCDTQAVRGVVPPAAASEVVQRPRSAMVQGAERYRHVPSLARSLLQSTNGR